MSADFTQLQLSTGVSSPTGNSKNKEGSWFESLADAWGDALDQQANRISALSSDVTQGQDNPSQITELTAESLRMSFISNSSHTSLTSAGTALETLARKQ